MEFVLERGSIDKLLTFDIGLIQLSFHTSVFTQCMQGVFNPNIATFQSNIVNGLHFSAFYFLLYLDYFIYGCSVR